MKTRPLKIAAWMIATSIVLSSPACTGEDPLPPPPDGGSTSAPPPTPTGSTGVVAECQKDEDCVARMPVTTPPDCATASCDPVSKRCRFQAKDADGDGHAAKNCVGATAPVETGDDCDDNDPSTHPGAWDGPATDVDSGPEARADRCDQRDNDCNGTPDDGKIAVDGGDKTCTCDPNAPLPCYEYENGVPIDAATLDLDNKPKGACKKGLRSCTNGVPGACIGAVGPTAEQCDDLDHDCDGLSGNAGDAVTGAPKWIKDADNDGYGDLATPPKEQCVAPGPEWKTDIPNTDCKDDDATVHPGHSELCDGKDNNCNGSVDDGFDIGGNCVAGSNGVCRRNGKLECATTSTTTCKPGAGTSGGESLMPSSDPLIYKGSDSDTYSAVWDWNCNGVIETRADGLINFHFASPGAASNLCSGLYDNACSVMGSTEATCLPVVYPCGQSCGTGCKPVQSCGKTLRVAYCSWNVGEGRCKTYAQADKSMYCR